MEMEMFFLPCIMFQFLIGKVQLDDKTGEVNFETRQVNVSIPHR